MISIPYVHHKHFVIEVNPFGQVQRIRPMALHFEYLIDIPSIAYEVDGQLWHLFAATADERIGDIFHKAKIVAAE